MSVTSSVMSSSSIKKILVRPKSSMNLNAKPFYPKGHQERLEKEDKYFDQLENVWWEQNKNMFEDSLNDSINMSKQEIKLKPITSSPSWADIVNKNK